MDRLGSPGQSGEFFLLHAISWLFKSLSIIVVYSLQWWGRPAPNCRRSLVPFYRGLSSYALSWAESRPSAVEERWRRLNRFEVHVDAKEGETILAVGRSFLPAGTAFCFAQVPGSAFHPACSTASFRTGMNSDRTAEHRAGSFGAPPLPMQPTGSRSGISARRDASRGSRPWCRMTCDITFRTEARFAARVAGKAHGGGSTAQTMRGRSEVADAKMAPPFWYGGREFTDGTWNW